MARPRCRARARWRRRRSDPASGIFVARDGRTGCTRRRGRRQRGIHPRRPRRLRDRRLRTGYRGCEYDGRLSVVHFRGRHWLYARANLRECAPTGGRFVHVATLGRRAAGSPFQLLTIDALPEGFGRHLLFRRPAQPRRRRLAARARPPLSQPAGGCIAAAFSADGARWTSAAQAARLQARARRTDRGPPRRWRRRPPRRKRPLLCAARRRASHRAGGHLDRPLLPFRRPPRRAHAAGAEASLHRPPAASRRRPPPRAGARGDSRRGAAVRHGGAPRPRSTRRARRAAPRRRP